MLEGEGLSALGRALLLCALLALRMEVVDEGNARRAAAVRYRRVHLRKQ